MNSMIKEDCICKNTGWLEITEKRENVLPVKDQKTGEINFKIETIEVPVVVPCPHCRDKKEQILTSLEIPERFADASFENFDTMENTNLIKAKRLCLDYVEKFLTLREQNSLLFMGPPGVGKTHLAVAILRKIAYKYQISARFMDFRDILAMIKTSYQNRDFRGEEHIFNEVMKIDLVVIDELGSEQVTDWVKEVVHRLIIPRYNYKLATIFTTNYIDEEHYQQHTRESTPKNNNHPIIHETLTERTGFRLRSKLKEMCQVISIFESDYRNNFTDLLSRPNESNRAIFQSIQKLNNHFQGLAKRVREGFYLDAYQYNHSLAMQYPEAVAMWIYGRNKNKLPADLPIWRFIKILHRVQNTNGLTK
ncbi:ATP-binding protein [candidate division CSSED10-310 bacterium]|uniref:ATP-binding protein n=1 Tax=candidate division CSSED10-310 bacterium TaxID=2855610 RepID=A0ABV6YYA9_UNCC1